MDGSIITAVYEAFGVLTDLIEQQATAIDQLVDLIESRSTTPPGTIDEAKALSAKTRQGVTELRRILATAR